MARAHAKLFRQFLHTQIALQVGRNPPMQAHQAHVRVSTQGSGLGIERSTELGLPGRAPEEHGEISRQLKRDMWAEILFDQAQRQVDTGSGTRARPEIAIVQIQPFGLALQRRVAGLQLFGKFPVGHHLATLEQPGCGQGECTCTYGAQPAYRRGATA